MGNKTNTIVVGSVVVAILVGISIYYGCKKNDDSKKDDKKGDRDKIIKEAAQEGESSSDTTRPNSDQEALISKSENNENKSV